jgi:hypothetical protein
MINLIALFFGSVVLGITITYVFWISVRTTIFQAELQSIRFELDSKMRSLGKTDDENYLRLRELIHFFVENAQYLSIPVLKTFLKFRLASIQKVNSSEKEANLHDSLESLRKFVEAEDSPAEVKDATVRLVTRIVVHLMLTPTMIFWVVRHSVFGRTEQLVKEFASLRANLQDFQKLASAVK